MSVLVKKNSGGSGHAKGQGPNLNSGWVMSVGTQEDTDLLGRAE